MTAPVRDPGSAALRGPLYRLGAFALALLVGGVVIGALLGILAQQGIMKQRVHGVLQPLPMLATGALAVLLLAGVSRLIVRRFEARDLSAIGLPVTGGARDVGMGLLLGILVPVGSALLLLRLGVASILPAHVDGSVLLTATIPMLGAIALLSTWEELCFRGYPLRMLREAGGPWTATILTGLAFGLIHAGNPGANPLGLVLTAVNGVLLGWVVLRSGSLWIACGYHAGWNLMAALVLGMRDSGIVTPGAFFRTTLTGSPWLTGGEYGFEASIVTGALECVLLSLLVVFAPRLVRASPREGV